jgi:hypothetical protein
MAKASEQVQLLEGKWVSSIQKGRAAKVLAFEPTCRAVQLF